MSNLKKADFPAAVARAAAKREPDEKYVAAVTSDEHRRRLQVRKSFPAEKFGLPAFRKLRDLVAPSGRYDVDSYRRGSAATVEWVEEDPDGLKRTRAVDAVDDFLRGWNSVGRGPGLLVLGGSTGTGKTVALARLVVKTAGLFVGAFEVGLRPRNGWSTNEEAWESWLEARLLGVDDVGVDGSEKNAASLGDLVLARWGKGLPTVLSTNVAAKEFAARVFGANAERFADRLRGENPVPSWYVVCSGKSLRGGAK